MKRKSLLICGLLLTCSYAYSMDNTSGKLLSHKEWVTGNGKAIFKSFHKTSNTPFDFNSLSKNQNSPNIIINTSTKALDIEPWESPFAKLSGEHTIRISNYSPSHQRFTIKHSVCAFEKIGFLTKVVSCAESMDEVILDDLNNDFNQKVISGLYIYKTEMKDKNYLEHVITEVITETGETVFMSEDEKPVPKFD